MKKKIALLMACAMTVASLAGCGGGSGSGTTNTTAAAGGETTAAANGETKAAAGGETSLVMYWWGNQVRNELYNVRFLPERGPRQLWINIVS